MNLLRKEILKDLMKQAWLNTDLILSNLNYFVCARIWCIKDKLALTPEQFLR